MTDSGLPKTETRAQFAARLGVHRSTITRAVEAGRLVLHENGHILVAPSLKRWHETKAGRTDMEARHAENRGAAIPEADQSQKNATAGRAASRGRNSAATEPLESTLEDTAGTPGRSAYKAMVLKYENDAIKLHMALRRGHRYPVEAIREEASAIGGTLRAAMERLIDQTAPRLAVLTDPAARLRLLQAECRTLARILKNEFHRAMRRLQRSAKKS